MKYTLIVLTVALALTLVGFLGSLLADNLGYMDLPAQVFWPTIVLIMANAIALVVAIVYVMAQRCRQDAVIRKGGWINSR